MFLYLANIINLFSKKIILLNLKNMENNNYAKGGKVIGKVISKDGVDEFVHQFAQKYSKIGISDIYFIEASEEVGYKGINFDENTLIKKINAEYEKLLDSYSSYVITQDSPSITNYILNTIETLTEEGASVEELEKERSKIENKDERNKIVSETANTQKESLQQWVSYLKSDSFYSIPFKYLILKAVLSFNYDLAKNKLFERSETTIRNFTPFDAGTLAELYDSKSTFLLLDYNKILNDNAFKIFNSKEIISETKGGKWIKFNGGKKTKPEDIQKNGVELMKLVQNTFWCTKTRAVIQLEGGDFYVYVTESNGEVFPRIAIRMVENNVGEVRGNASSSQDIEADMLPIAEDFLVKNIPNNSGRKWLNSIKYNQRCVEITKRMESEGLYEGFVFDYIKVWADRHKFKVDYGANGNVTKMEMVFKEQKDKLPNKYYKRGEIEENISLLNKKTKYFFGDIDSYQLSKLNALNMKFDDLSEWDLSVVSGELYCGDTITNLGNLEYVGGDLTLSRNIQNLSKLQYVGGKFNIGESQIESLDNLEYLGSEVIINNKLKNLGKLKSASSITILSCDESFTLGNVELIENDLVIKTNNNFNLGQLKRINGSLIASKSLLTNLSNLEFVGKDFDISGSKIKDFGNLNFIGGNADFSNNFSSNTQKIETILGDVKLLNSRIVEFTNLIKIGGSIEFRGSYIKSLGSLKNIGGNLNLIESKIEDLGELETVGTYASFKGSKVTNLNKLKKISSFANFDDSIVEDLGNLEIIGGNAYFNNTKINSLGKLNYIGGTIRFGNNKTLEQLWSKISKK